MKCKQCEYFKLNAKCQNGEKAGCAGYSEDEIAKWLIITGSILSIVVTVSIIYLTVLSYIS